MEHILLFCTGSSSEPVLGFSMEPTMHFNDNVVLATSNTCVSQMWLSLLSVGQGLSEEQKKDEKEQNYSMYDYAFTSEYFGMN